MRQRLQRPWLATIFLPSLSSYSSCAHMTHMVSLAILAEVGLHRPASVTIQPLGLFGGGGFIWVSYFAHTGRALLLCPASTSVSFSLHSIIRLLSPSPNE